MCSSLPVCWFLAGPVVVTTQQETAGLSENFIGTDKLNFMQLHIFLLGGLRIVLILQQFLIAVN